LSCGYTCDLEKAEDGAKWCGIDYDFIQRNIRYNHVAIVDRARAGDDARIRMDGISVNIKNDNEEETNMPDVFKKVNLDGVEYQAEAPVLTALHTAKERADKAEIALKDTLTAFIDFI
jgi:hypothetical protein